MKSKNFVITRFNLAVRFGCSVRKDSEVPKKQPWLNEEYLSERFKIFEKYTFPSVKDQTDKDFIWIVLFHQDTPDQFKKRIDDLAKKMKNFNPVYLNDDGCERLSQSLNELLCTQYEVNSLDYYMTTRLDNDDVIHKDFISLLKENTKQLLVRNRSAVISYPLGLQYNIKDRDVLNYTYRQNHFISFLNMGKDTVHVLSFDHSKIEDNSYPIHDINTKIPMWIELITENNYSNAMHWRYKNIIISPDLGEEYPILDLKWSRKIDYIIYVFKQLFKVIIMRGRGFFRTIFK